MNRGMALRRLRPLAAALASGTAALSTVTNNPVSASPVAKTGLAVNRLAAAAVIIAPSLAHKVICVERPGTHIETTDHEFTMPLDWSAGSGGGTIVVFAREVVSLRNLDKKDDLPWLVFLQGGPGGAAIRPSHSGWLKRALTDYRVLLLDQRGTGNSTPVTSETFEAVFGSDAEKGAEYLANFRADSIVADAEAIRVLLAGKVHHAFLASKNH